MATITFKAKRRDMPDGTYYINVPVLTRSHCDMAAFRQHERYGGLANSDLFGNALAHIRRAKFGEAAILSSEKEYPGVSVDHSSFLAVVTIEV